MSGHSGDEIDSLRSWLIVCAAFLTLLVSWGTVFSFGVFLDPLATEFGYSQVAISLVFSAETFAVYVVAGLLGILITRVRVRAIVTAVAVGIALLSGVFQIVSSYLALLAVFTVLGLGMGLMYVVVVSITPLWFEEHRGIATGVFFAGNGLGMQVMPPLWSWLIESYGIRTAFTIVLLGAAAIYAMAALVIRRPRQTSTEPDDALGDLRAWLTRVLTEPHFPLLFLAILLLFTWYFTFSTHAINIFTAWGMERGFATILFGFIGGSSIVARIVSGVVGQQLGYRRTITGTLALAALGFFLLLTRAPMAIYAAVILMGIGLGTASSLYVPTLLGIFDPSKDTAIVGIASVAMGVGALIAPPLSTLAIDATGSYLPVLAATGLLTALNVLLFWHTTNPSHWNTNV